MTYTMDSANRISGIIAFVRAAHTGSFTAAAKVLDITPAAVSKSVAALEQSLGVRLMNRTTRSLSLTAEGETFLSQASQALNLLDNAYEAISGAESEPSGLVRISVSNVIGRNLIMPILPHILARFPQLRIEIDFDDRIIDFVQEGYDLVIRAGNMTDSSMISRHIGTLKRCLVASPAYLEKHGIPRLPSQLSNHKLITRRFLGSRTLPWRFIQPDGSVYSYEPVNPILTLSDPGALLQAAIDSVGITETGVYLAWENLKQGRLKLVLFDQHDPGDFQMMIQYPHRVLVAQRVKAVADFIQQTLKTNEGLNVTTLQMSECSALINQD